MASRNCGLPTPSPFARARRHLCIVAYQNSAGVFQSAVKKRRKRSQERKMAQAAQGGEQCVCILRYTYWQHLAP